MTIIPAAQVAAARRAAAELARQAAAAEAERRRAWPVWIHLPRVLPLVEQTPSGCGCGRA
jgi:hypothetical protein